MGKVKEGLGIILSIMFFMSSQAATYYVSPGGNDDANGLSWSTAFKTISRGIIEADNRDIVEVNKGTYYENVNFNGKALTLTGLNPFNWNVVESTIIDANGFGDTIKFSSGEDACSILKGFTIRGGDYGIRCANSTKAEIKRCIIQNTNNGILCDSNGTTPTISGSIIKDNNNSGILCMNGAAPVIKNNLIYNNNHGITSINSGLTVIRNNTIVNNTGKGIQNSGQNPVIHSCIIWNCNDDLYNCSATYSCIQDGDSGTGNISFDPCFVDAGSSDFHLKPESLCIDAGSPEDTFLYENETDLDGFPRVSICESPIWLVDIGAYEYQRYNNSDYDCVRPCGECPSDLFPISLNQWGISDAVHFGWQNVSSGCNACLESFTATFKAEDNGCVENGCWQQTGPGGYCEVNVITVPYENVLLFIELKGRTERNGTDSPVDYAHIYVDGMRKVWIGPTYEGIDCETSFHREYAIVPLIPSLSEHKISFFVETWDKCNNRGVYFDFKIKTYRLLSLFDGRPCDCPIQCPFVTPTLDSDNDVIPDEWELAVCLNPYDSNDSNLDRNSDGISNLEEYLNWLSSGEPIPANTNINCDDIVNFKDFSEFAEHWMTVSTDEIYSGRYDFGHNYTITMDDLFYLAQDWLTAGQIY